MELDLYKIYKLMSQRARRHPIDIRRAEIKQLSKQLITDELNKAEMLEVADRIEALENSLASISRFYAPDLRKAIVEDSYTCEIPHQIAHRWNERESSRGYIYVATSKSKPGQAKLGATSLWPDERLRKYRYRYGYPMTLRWSKFVNRPFDIERIVQGVVSDNRVKTLTDGDSNEWYQIDSSQLVGVIESKVSENASTPVGSEA